MLKPKPNIVLVIMDTARAANFSCYGYEKITSPNVDKLAEKGILFRNAITPSPWTLPSHISMFTGLYPSEHGLTEDKIVSGKNIYGLSKQHMYEFFLPQILKTQGYRTAGFSNNPWISHQFGFARGFDVFYEAWAQSETQSLFRRMLRSIRRVSPQMMHPILNNLRVRMGWLFRSDSGAKNTIEVFQKWLGNDRSDDSPYFAFFNFMEPHLPYMPPKPFDQKFFDQGLHSHRLRAVNQDHLKFIAGKVKMEPEDFSLLQSLYDGEIAYLDSQLKEIFDCMQDCGVLDNTLLILTSDHGENIGEHGLMGHQFCLYDTLLRVPLIIKLPGSAIKGKRDDKYVQVSDLFYTLLDVLGIQIDGRDISNRSLLDPSYSGVVISEHEVPKITLSSLRKRFPYFPERNLDQEMKCLYADGTKYIWNSKGEDEMYDLTQDPAEESNLIHSIPDQAAKLFRLLRGRTELMKKDTRKKEIPPDLQTEEVDPRVQEKLRDLGYI